MATAKQQPKRILYHIFFCGEGNLGEADGFFSLENGKLEYVSGWDANDAHWRREYMTGLLDWAGVEVKTLPEKYLDEAVKIAEKMWGLEDDETDETSGEAEETELYFREGTSDKVYQIALFQDDGTWWVNAHYGRRGSNLREEWKASGEPYEAAKKIYDKVIQQKLKKGYQVS